VTADDLPLPTLLSRLLIAFTIEFDNEAEHRLDHRRAQRPRSCAAPLPDGAAPGRVARRQLTHPMPAGPLGWAVPGRPGQDGAVIGRLHHVIVDCPDPVALAGFYAELLGLPITWQEEDFAVVARDDKSSGIGFQLAPDFQPPQWPGPGRPQQIHFDVMVDDVDAAEPRVLALGARRLTGGDGGSRVYADPAGHPFCLIPRPGWAAPIGGAQPGVA
jgi:catechol 2,3-dioxygenase-like lactoylglutathione lyase family enzyme